MQQRKGWQRVAQCRRRQVPSRAATDTSSIRAGSRFDHSSFLNQVFAIAQLRRHVVHGWVALMAQSRLMIDPENSRDHVPLPHILGCRGSRSQLFFVPLGPYLRLSGRSQLKSAHRHYWGYRHRTVCHSCSIWGHQRGQPSRWELRSPQARTTNPRFIS